MRLLCDEMSHHMQLIRLGLLNYYYPVKVLPEIFPDFSDAVSMDRVDMHDWMQQQQLLFQNSS